MSYYYCYRLGYKKDEKLYPLFPFSADGRWKDAICHSRSYDTKLHEDFNSTSVEMLSDEMKQMICKDYLDPDVSNEDRIKEVVPYIKWLPLKELPKGDYIKRGYFLISDVETYERRMEQDGWCDADIFYDTLSVTVYNSRLKNAMMLGDDAVKDEEGNIVEHAVRDYMYYVYPDYNCKEYDAFILRTIAESCEYFDYKNGGEIVVIDWEG